MRHPIDTRCRLRESTGGLGEAWARDERVPPALRLREHRTPPSRGKRNRKPETNRGFRLITGAEIAEAAGVARARTLASRKAGALVAVAFAGLVVAVALPAGAATSSPVVGAIVPSATNIDVSGCAPGMAGRTHFGSVLPGVRGTKPCR